MQRRSVFKALSRFFGGERPREEEDEEDEGAYTDGSSYSYSETDDDPPVPSDHIAWQPDRVEAAPKAARAPGAPERRIAPPATTTAAGTQPQQTQAADASDSESSRYSLRPRRRRVNTAGQVTPARRGPARSKARSRTPARKASAASGREEVAAPAGGPPARKVAAPSGPPAGRVTASPPSASPAPARKEPAPERSSSQMRQQGPASSTAPARQLPAVPAVKSAATTSAVVGRPGGMNAAAAESAQTSALRAACTAAGAAATGTRSELQRRVRAASRRGTFEGEETQPLDRTVTPGSGGAPAVAQAATQVAADSRGVTTTTTSSLARPGLDVAATEAADGKSTDGKPVDGYQADAPTTAACSSTGFQTFTETFAQKMNTHPPSPSVSQMPLPQRVPVSATLKGPTPPPNGTADRPHTLEEFAEPAAPRYQSARVASPASDARPSARGSLSIPSRLPPRASSPGTPTPTTRATRPPAAPPNTPGLTGAHEAPRDSARRQAMTRSAAAEVANSLQHVQSASGEIGDVETVSHRQQIVDLHIDGVELQEVVRPRNPVTPPTGVEGAVPRGAGPPTMAAPAALQTGGAPHADTPTATNAAARPPRGSARARPATVRVPPGGTAGGMQERGDRVTRREASPARGSMPLRPTPVRPPPARPSIARTSGFPTPSDIIRTFNRYTPSNRPVSASPGGGLTARAGSTPYARPSSERFRSNDFHRLVGSAFGVSLGTPLSGAPTAGNAGLFNSPARPPSNSKRHSTGMASFRRRAASASGGRLNDLRKNRRSVDFGRPGALQSLNEMHATNRWREADRAEAMATSARKILEGLSRTREENRMLAQKLKEEGSSPIGPPPSSLKRSREAGGFGGEGGKRARRSVRDSGVLIPSAFNPNPPGAGSQARPRPPETMVEAGKARSNKRKSMSFVKEEEGAENVLERVAARKRRSVSYSAASNLGSAFKAYALAQSQKDVARKSGFEPSAGKSEGKERGEDARSVVRRRIEAHESGVGTRTAFGTAGASAFNKATEVAKAVSTFKPSAGDGQRKKLNPILNKSPNDGTPKAHKAVTFADGGAKRKVSFGEVEEKDEVTPAPAFKFNIPSPLVKKTSDEVVKATAAKPLFSMPKSGEVEKKEAEKESAADKFTFGTPVGFNSANIEPAVVGPTPAVVETAAAPTAMEAPVVSAPAASVPAPAPAVASLGGFEAARKPAAVKETAAPTADLFGAKPGGEAAKTLLSFVQPAEAPKETEEVKKPAAPAPFSFGDAVKPGDSATGVFAFPVATKPAASAPEEVKASESKETTEPAPTPAVTPTTLPVATAEPPKPTASEPAPAASLPVPKAALPSAKSGFGAPTTSAPEGVFSFKTQSAPAAAAAAPSKPSEPTPFASAPPGFGAPAFGQPAESASAPAASNPFGSSAPAFGAGSGPKPSGNPFGESTSFNPSATVQGFQFGSAPAATGSGGPFGATPSAPSASAPALAGSGGGFGGQSTPFGDGGGFSGGNAFVFGGSQPAPAAPAAPFSSGAGSAPAFGFGGASAAGSAPFGGASAPATAPTPFGSSAATPFGSAPTFGSASGPAGFGGGSAPQFGPPASTPFGGPAQSAPAPFGGPAQSASQPFGAPAPSASAPFGAFGGGQSAPQFGAPAQGAQSQAAQTLFGGAPPAGSGFSMGANGNQTGSKPRRVLKCRRSKRG